MKQTQFASDLGLLCWQVKKIRAEILWCKLRVYITSFIIKQLYIGSLDNNTVFSINQFVCHDTISIQSTSEA